MKRSEYTWSRREIHIIFQFSL